MASGHRGKWNTLNLPPGQGYDNDDEDEEACHIDGGREDTKGQGTPTSTTKKRKKKSMGIAEARKQLGFMQSADDGSLMMNQEAFFRVRALCLELLDDVMRRYVHLFIQNPSTSQLARIKKTKRH